MFDAQVVIARLTTYTLRGPWMSRLGDNVVVSIDYVKGSGSPPEIQVELLTKGAEDAGDGVPTTTSLSLAPNSPGVASAKLEGELKDLVRYEFTIVATIEAAGDWGMFRTLPEIWYDSV